MNYKLETHSHTKEVSPCSWVYSKDLVDTYISHGYDGIIITDHYFTYFFDDILSDIPWEEKVDEYLKGYHNAKKYAENRSFTDFIRVLG